MKNKQSPEKTISDLIKENKSKIIKNLKTRTNITRVEVYYNGSGDSGAIDYVTFFGLNDEQIDKENIPNIKIKYYNVIGGWPNRLSDLQKESNITEAIEDFCWDVLTEKRPGWEINDGSQGCLKFDVDKGTVILEHTEFYMESNDYFDEV